MYTRMQVYTIDRSWYRKLVLFYKIAKKLFLPSYLQSHLCPWNERTYNARSSSKNTVDLLPRGHQFFAQLFFLLVQKNEFN